VKARQAGRLREVRYRQQVAAEHLVAMFSKRAPGAGQQTGVEFDGAVRLGGCTGKRIGCTGDSSACECSSLQKLATTQINHLVKGKPHGLTIEGDVPRFNAKLRHFALPGRRTGICHFRPLVAKPTITTLISIDFEADFPHISTTFVIM
jgi:hypothetical protein